MDIAVKRFYISLYIPVILVVVLWLVFALDQSLDLDLFFYGIYPRKLTGLKGILFSPFIHGSLKHIIANTIPVLVLTTGLFYFYRGLSFRVLIFSILLTNILVWVMARPSYHIGASGLIYSLAGFLFLSGVLRKHTGLMALSLIIVFQYGSLVWGIFPLEEKVSWEGHLMGLFAGFGLSWVYRNQGPQKQKFPWENNAEDEDDDTNLPWSEYEIEGDRKPITYE
jgi:membrane associated rhomboid family serine protease